jgi:hypothetical protein
MPTDPVIVDTTIVAVGTKIPNYGTVLVVGRESGGTAAVNTPMLLSNLTDVATYFGGSTDTYNAAVNLFQQGVAEAYFVKATNTVVAAESVTKGSLQTLAHTVVAGNPIPVIAAHTFVFTDGTPTDPGAGKAMLNPRTGQIFINVGGGGSASIAYSYTDWTNLILAISQQSIALAMLAESPMTFQFYGDWYTFINSYLDVYRIIGVAAAGWTGAESVSTILAPITIYSTRHLVAVAHKDVTNDVAASVIGVLSGIKPWDKLMWKNIDELDMTAYFSKSEVATLEAANVNAMINKSGLDRISDGLTRGVATLYEYVDIVRTRYYLESLIIEKLDYLIANTIIQYTAEGINLVKSTVESACQEAVDVGALRTPIEVNGALSKGYVVEVPTYDSIPLADKEGRILRNVFVTARLPGHIQEIRLNLTLEIGG